MKKGATQEQVEHMKEKIQSLGLKAMVIVGTERTVIAAIGDERRTHRDSLESGAGVDEVVPILAPYKIASSEVKSEPTVIQDGSLTVGDGHIGVIAGPCSVESEEQIVSTARAVKKSGATALRGGAFKPRTSPYSFQGLKEEGLKMLATARTETGLAVVTEIIAAEDLQLVCEYADVLQIGARNMQNYRLLEAVVSVRHPVLLKRGLMSTINEWFMSAEYVMANGNYNVILCERGIRTFETSTRSTLDLNAVPLAKKLSHLPVIVDPSHGTGKWDLVTPMARAAIAAGADGLMIEVHPRPEEALSDGFQSLKFEKFGKLMDSIKPVAKVVDREV